MFENVEPELLVTRLTEKLENDGPEVRVFWARVDRERHQYCADLRETVDDYPIFPIVVDIDGFRNPNAILHDVVRVIESNRDTVEEQVRSRSKLTPFCLLLLARGDLGISQAASPVTLPKWIPEVGGRTVRCRIQDLASGLDAPFDASELNVDRVRSALYWLEKAIVKRIDSVIGHDHQRKNRLLDLVRKVKSEDDDVQSLISSAKSALDAVESPRSYRISVGRGNGFTSFLLQAYGGSGPDQVRKIGRALADALALQEVEQWRPSLQSVLQGPLSPEQDPATKWASDLVRSIFAAHQLSTAAAHADEYPRYPVLLLRSVSHDLRRFMVEARGRIESME